MRRVLIAAVASSLLTGAVIGAAAIAQSGGDDDKPPPTMAEALKEHEAARDGHLAAVARRLDVPASDLEKAIESAREAQLDQAVRDGRLSDAQRDAIRACKDAPLTCDRSNLPAPRLHRRGLRMREGRPDLRAMRREMRARRNAFFAAVAKELGKETADVRRAFEAERPRAGRRGRHGPRGLRGPGGPHGDMVMPGPGPGGPGGP